MAHSREQALAFVASWDKRFFNAHLGHDAMPVPKDFASQDPDDQDRCETACMLAVEMCEVLLASLRGRPRQARLDFEVKGRAHSAAEVSADGGGDGLDAPADTGALDDRDVSAGDPEDDPDGAGAAGAAGEYGSWPPGISEGDGEVDGGPAPAPAAKKPAVKKAGKKLGKKLAGAITRSVKKKARKG